MSSFRDLEVWREAHNLTLKVYEVTKTFPAEERYRLVDQLCRAAASIPANIAEGKGRRSQKDFLRFLTVARGSVEETKYHLLLAHDLGYIESELYTELASGYDTVGKMLNGLIARVEGEVQVS
ncbi:MAG: four helix bundle protein [Candidatus Bipolaricaulia bacterium]